MSQSKVLRNAYNNARREGKSKEEAREIQQQAKSEYWEKRHQREFGGKKKECDHYNEESDFDSDLNGNGTNWHTAEDI